MTPNPTAAEAWFKQVCSSCGELKPLSKFTRNRRSPTGYFAACKGCVAAFREGVAHRVESEVPRRCPTCRVPAFYLSGADRYFHADGSDNDKCWLAILRGEVSLP